MGVYPKAWHDKKVLDTILNDVANGEFSATEAQDLLREFPKVIDLTFGELDDCYAEMLHELPELALQDEEAKRLLEEEVLPFFRKCIHDFR